jgi:fructose 5-dehydrogenase small subunit
MLLKEDCPPRSFPVTRRNGLLLGIAGAGLLAGGALNVDRLLAQSASAPPAPPSFLAVSNFVTSADLDDATAVQRAWEQLCALDAGFAQAVERLHTAITQSGAKTMAQWLATPVIHDAALMATARTITSAFYLGYTGDPDSQAPHDTNGFVTFTGALMWRPTIDATIIPTYARGGTDYWVKPPAGTPVPKGPQGNPAWTGSTNSSHTKA